MLDFPASEGILAECSLIADRRRVTVERRGEGRAMIGVGPHRTIVDGCYEDTYEYLDADLTLAALAMWNPRKSDEPDGWHWHPGSGRCRIDGSRALEYVRVSGDDILAQILWAVQVTQGHDRYVVELEETSMFESLLAGSRDFMVVSESTLCPGHPSKCRYYDRVIVHANRCVVLSTRDLICTSLATTIRRLTGDHNEVQELAVEAVEEIEFDSLN